VDETRPGEDALIARYFRPLAGPAGLGLLDDVALLTPPAGQEIVLTVDAVVAGVHFFPDDPPEAVGWKALAVNLSDLASKGAEPLGFLLSLALPSDWTPAWLERFAAGLGECAAEGGCPLLGGDTVKTPGPLTLSITAVGGVPAGRMARRTGAQPGDVVFVSGTIGDAALGLALRQRAGAPWVAALGDEDRTFLADRYVRPRPRLALREAVRQFAHGAMDVSDGLVGDLTKMLAASGVAGRLRLEDVPLSPAARRAVQAEPALALLAATGGDDYEVLCTVPAGDAEAFVADAGQAGVPVTAIGEVLAGQGLTTLREGSPIAVESASFSHF
jgi:thiamine-monophosphate kinase